MSAQGTTKRDAFVQVMTALALPTTFFHGSADSASGNPGHVLQIARHPVAQYLSGGILLAGKVGGVMTATVLVQHFGMEALADRNWVRRTAGVKRVPLTPYDLVHYCFNASVTFLLFCLHVNATWAFGVPEKWAQGWRAPTLLQLSLYSALVLVLSDSSFYFPHRLMHTCWHKSRFLRWLHKPHHRVHLANGMKVSDAMVMNPIEPWFNVMPGYHVSYLVMCALPEPNVYAAVFAFWVAMMLINLGHCGYNINLAWPMKRVMGANPVYIHAFHHKDTNKNFGLFFCWWDKMCGTYHDYHAAAQKVITE